MKRVLLVLCMCLLVGCGSNNTENDVNEEELTHDVENVVDSVTEDDTFEMLLEIHDHETEEDIFITVYSNGDLEEEIKDQNNNEVILFESREVDKITVLETMNEIIDEHKGMNLKKDISDDSMVDGGLTYITLTLNNRVHRFGGSGATHSDSKMGQRYNAIYDAIMTLYNSSVLVVEVDEDVTVEETVNETVDEVDQETTSGVIESYGLFSVESVVASSELYETYSGGTIYNYASNVLDSDRTTAWCESIKGHGIGEWLLFESDSQGYIYDISLINGYVKKETLYQMNDRLKKAVLTFDDGTTLDIEFEDQNLELQTIYFDEPVLTKTVMLTISEVYPGDDYPDLCITEVMFNQGQE